MTIRFHPEATAELDDAIRQYSRVRPDIGLNFQQEASGGLDVILGWPNAWPRVEADARRYRLRQFPYGIVYKAYRDRIVVYAVMHLSRRPGYWVDRLNS